MVQPFQLHQFDLVENSIKRLYAVCGLVKLVEQFLPDYRFDLLNSPRRIVVDSGMAPETKQHTVLNLPSGRYVASAIDMMGI